MNIGEFRIDYPEYDHVSDNELSTALHKKFYSDVPFEKFETKFNPKRVEQREVAQERISAVQAIEVEEPSVMEDIIKPTIAEIGDIGLGAVETAAQFFQAKFGSLPVGVGVASMELISQVQSTLIDTWKAGKPVSRIDWELINRKMETVMQAVSPLQSTTEFAEATLETLTAPIAATLEQIEKIDDPQVKAAVKVMGTAAITASIFAPNSPHVSAFVKKIKSSKQTRFVKAAHFTGKELSDAISGVKGAKPKAVEFIKELGAKGELVKFAKQRRHIVEKGASVYLKQEKLLLKPKSEWTTTDVQVAVDGIRQITYQPKNTILQNLKSMAQESGRDIASIAYDKLTSERGVFHMAKKVDGIWQEGSLNLLIPKEGVSPLKRVGVAPKGRKIIWEKGLPPIIQIGNKDFKFKPELKIEEWAKNPEAKNLVLEGEVGDLITPNENFTINPNLKKIKAKITISNQITDYEQSGRHDVITGEVEMLVRTPQKAKEFMLHELGGHEADKIIGLPRGGSPFSIQKNAESELIRLNNNQAKIGAEIRKLKDETEMHPSLRRSLFDDYLDIYEDIAIQINDLPFTFNAAIKVYKNLQGEIAARDVQAKSELTTAELQHRQPFDTQSKYNVENTVIEYYNVRARHIDQAIQERRSGRARRQGDGRRADDLKQLVVKLNKKEAKIIESIMPSFTDMKVPKFNSKDHTLTFADNFMQYLDYVGFVNKARPDVRLTKKLYDLIEEKSPIDITESSRFDSAMGDLLSQMKRILKSERGSLVGKKKGKPFIFPKNIETRFQKAHGISKEPLGTRTKSQLNSFWHKLTREFEYLPKTAEFADLQFGLNRAKKLQGISSFQTIQALDELTVTLKGKAISDSKNAFDLYRRKIIMDDLVETLKLNPDTELPFGFDSTTLNQEAIRLDEAIKTTPGVDSAIIRGAVEKRGRFLDELTLEYTKWMKTMGKDFSKSFTRKSYYRHQILDRLQLKSNERLHKGLKVPPKPKFAMERKGSKLDINTNYFEAEGEVISKMLYDIQIAKTINNIRQSKYNIAAKTRLDAKERGIENWYDAIPDGYVTWQPREGNVFYTADTIPAQLADKISEGLLAELKIDPTVLKKALAKGRRFEEFVVKEDIAKTLDTLFEHPVETALGKASSKMLNAWKGYIALSHPKGILKFNIRNMTGDADAVYIGNPSTFTKSPQAIAELATGYVRRGELTQNLKDFFELGAIDATLLSQELSTGGQLDLANRFIQKNGGLTKIPEKVWKGYWKGARMLSDTRELTLRYAAYLDYLEQMKANQGIPNNFGASIPEEIIGLSDIKQRAFWLSNDLLGAYDRVGIIGQQIAKHAIPFWRWKEVNFTRYNRFMKNAIKDEQFQIETGKGMIDRVYKKKGSWKNFVNPARLAKIGRFALRATTMWAAVHASNEYIFTEEEKGLPNNVRSRPHIILGKDDKGDVIHFDRIGALGDYLEWFGLDDSPQKYKDFMTGRKTLNEIIKDMALAPVNVVVQGITPLLKVPAEFLTRKSFFPDVASPRIIKDRALYVAQQLRLADEYKAIMDMPRKKYDISKLLIYKSDPAESAYHDTFDLKRNFLKSKKKGGEGYWISDRGTALFNMKMAIRYEDKELAEKYFLDYIAMGGDPATLSTSMDTLSPFSNMNEIDLGEFLLSLNEEEKVTVKKAFNFYEDNVFKAVEFAKTLDERVIMDVMQSIELPKALSKQEMEKLKTIIKYITEVE